MRSMREAVGPRCDRTFQVVCVCVCVCVCRALRGESGKKGGTSSLSRTHFRVLEGLRAYATIEPLRQSSCFSSSAHVVSFLA